ncbi:hypothetical protein MKW94_027254 [Papaver nudicaule]|uniref:Glutathione peroxidase n=1 Tax=Papaver nudicaule TaxID=74823 RepID=A0AA41SLQ0_PAPNU|nr:hypothetical protein [Papaver nudicaule]
MLFSLGGIRIQNNLFCILSSDHNILLVGVVLYFFFGFAGTQLQSNRSPRSASQKLDARGNDVDLSTYKGKALLIVNVASQWFNRNLTLHFCISFFSSEGLEILAFPCNQFGGQEPGNNEQIVEFACTRFKAEYPIFDKKSSKGGFLGDSIKWNFSKFLVDKEGHVVDRYAPTTSPLSIEKDIKKVLGVSA